MGSTTVKELIAKFSADTSGLESGSEKAQRVIGEFSKKAGLALAAAGAAFGALAVKQSLAGDELGKISQKFGVSVEALSRYDHAASLADVSTGELANSFKFMNNSLVDASKGSEASVKAYELLGLKFQDLIRMKPEESFLMIGDALSKIESPALKSALAVDIFGRAGANLLPMFKDGAAGISSAAQEAERFGLAITSVDTAALEAANDAVSKIGSAANGAARQFAVGLAPAVSSTVEALLAGVDAADWFRDSGKNTAATWIFGMESLSKILDATGIVFDELKMKILEATKAGMEFFHMDTSTLQNNMSGLAAQINRDQTNLDLRIAKKGGGYAQGSEGRYVSALAGQKAPRPAARDTANDLKILDALKTKTDDSEKSMKKLGETSKAAASGIDASFLGSARALDGFRQSAMNGIGQIGSALGSLLGGSGGGIRGKLGGIAGDFLGGALQNVVSGTFLGGSGFDLRSGINWNADGGVMSGRSVFPSSQGMQGAGEAGAEAIMPLARINGKLGVVAAGGGGGSVTQNITINAGVSQTVRAEMMRLLPQIKNEAVRAVAEGQARGKTP